MCPCACVCACTPRTHLHTYTYTTYPQNPQDSWKNESQYKQKLTLLRHLLLGLDEDTQRELDCKVSALPLKLQGLLASA